MRREVRKIRVVLAVLILALSMSSAAAVSGSPIRVQAAAASKQKNGWVKKSGKTYYYKNGKKVTGWQTIKKKQYYFTPSGKKKGQMVTGLQKIGKKKYYFTTSGKKKGQMITGWKIVKKNYYYFNEDGSLNTKKSVNSSRKSDKTGSESKKTLRRAQAIVEMITTPEMSKSQKLRKCFDYVMKYKGRRPRTPHSRAKNWPVLYANDMFLEGSGNCFSYAAAFGYLAKACGYKNVYCCNDTGHGWTEINGRIYDPEEYRNTKYKYYNTSYSSVPGYKRGISAWKSYPFMRVKL